MSFTSNAKKEQGLNNLKQAGRNFQESGREAAEELGQNLADKAENAGAEVRRYISDMSDKVSDARSELENAIHNKPVQSSVIALCAGVVLGLLFRR